MTVRHSLISFILKKSDWQSRRHQKAEKKEHLALQSELKSEIERKTRAIQDVREMGIESEKQVCQIEDGVLQCVALCCSVLQSVVPKQGGWGYIGYI